MEAFALSKTPVLVLTKLMAMELGPRGVRVINCICRRLIGTRFGLSVRSEVRSVSFALIVDFFENVFVSRSTKIRDQKHIQSPL
jgi:NAD(P)-dependent dehydrogenase (short-subunit alcohol dehydrogenase family)